MKPDFIGRTLRKTPPTGNDYAPYGAQCEVTLADDITHLYINVGGVEEPRWERMKNVLERAFWEQLQDPKFVHDMLNLYEKYESARFKYFQKDKKNVIEE